MIDLAEAHISLGISIMLNEWDWKKSEKEFKLGIELNPGYATGHHWYAEWCLFVGRFEEAFREINLAVELDPISQGILKDKGIYYYYTRQYDQAIDVAMVTLELDPNFSAAHRLLSLAYQALGRMDEAIEANQRWGDISNNNTRTLVGLAQIYGVSGRKEEALNILNQLESEGNLGGNDYRSVALAYTALGDKDKAFEWFEKSYQRHEESLCSLKIDPKLDGLRSDPRFKDLLRRIGLS